MFDQFNAALAFLTDPKVQEILTQIAVALAAVSASCKALAASWRVARTTGKAVARKMRRPVKQAPPPGDLCCALMQLLSGPTLMDAEWKNLTAGPLSVRDQENGRFFFRINDDDPTFNMSDNDRTVLQDFTKDIFANKREFLRREREAAMIQAAYASIYPMPVIDPTPVEINWNAENRPVAAKKTPRTSIPVQDKK